MAGFLVAPKTIWLSSGIVGIFRIRGQRMANLQSQQFGNGGRRGRRRLGLLPIY